MRRPIRPLAIVVAIAALTVAAGARRWRPVDALTSKAAPKTLVASIRAEPQSFNRYTSRDFTGNVLTYLMHASLVRVNRATNQIEPELAERWELLENRSYRLYLRRDVRFSDGTLFTAADVVFSFQAIYDPKSASALAETLQVQSKPLKVSAEDATTIRVEFPTPFAPGLRMLDGVPIYPRHLLEPSLADGSFRKVWGTTTAPSNLSGLGPFVLAKYEPGQRLTFNRNPYYWRRNEGLPRLDHVVLDILPDQTSESLRLATGAIDMTQSEVRPADARSFKRAVDSGALSMVDSGIGLDGDLFWINLQQASKRDPRSAWLQHADFRRAIAASVDRSDFADVVYLGEAVAADSIISPGNRQWHAATPPPAFDPDAARQLLAGLGLVDRHGTGMLEDRHGTPVRFTLLTQSGNTSLERGADVIKKDLNRVGIHVDVVALERSAMIDYVLRGRYDAAYFRLLTTDADPALNLDFWLSSGGVHIWNPVQRVPATVWERDIDVLMNGVATELDPNRRHAMFAEVQRIVARELPVVCFAFPRLSVALNNRVVSATPAPFRPPLLWNPAVIDIRSR